MSVAARNPFALLGDDGDESPAPAPAPKAAAPAAAAPARAIPGSAQANRGKQQQNRGGRNQTQPVGEVNADTPLPGANADTKDERAAQFGGRGGRGRGGRGGGRGGANPRSNGGTYLGGARPRRENGGGRPFDRQSQTGHQDSAKAEAQGWGADEGKAELQAELQGEKDAQVDQSGAATPAAQDGAATPARIPEEEEDNTQTYEEYLAQQAQNKLKIALPEKRQVNEGADESKWATQQAIKKSDQQAEEFLPSKEKTAKPPKEKKTKQLLEVEFSSKPPRRDGPRDDAGRGRGRGGRGGARGGARGRGAPRGAPRGQSNANSAPAPALNDANAFPTL